MISAHETTIEHLQLRNTHVEPTAARLRLSYLLSGVSLQPATMPPSAILVVRAMTDPLPRGITASFRPGALANEAWKRAAREQVNALYGSAVRPSRGDTAFSANAVLFHDYSEVLACLARDLSSGRAFAWWWHSILRRMPSPQRGSWLAEWFEHPRYVPAALEILDSTGEAAGVLESISPAQAWNLLRVVLFGYGIAEFPIVQSENAEPTPWRPSEAAEAARFKESLGVLAKKSEGTTGDPDGYPKEAIHVKQVNVTPPWEPYVPRGSTPSSLPYQHRALLGIGLLLRRAPQVTVASTFALRFRQWVVAEQLTIRMKEADLTPEGLKADVCIDWSPRPRRDSQNKGTARVSARDIATKQLDDSRVRNEASSTVEITPASTNNRSEHLGDRETGKTAASLTTEKPWDGGSLTHAGGILYLIHLLRDADILRHFDVGLGGWALLELLARCFLSDAVGLDDEIWGTLARLDGRDPQTSIESYFKPQHTYSAPDAWLRFSPENERYVRYRCRGVEIWNSAGFLTLDSQEISHPVGNVLRMSALQRRAIRRNARVRPLGLSPSPEMRRFLHFVLPYARCRLKRSLGATPISQVLMCPGALYVTRTHVDLVMSMDEISLPVRMAGLDANPGWVPELGHVITFHFE